MSQGHKKVKKNDIVDVAYTIKPKQTAVAVDAAFGSKPHARFEAPEQKWEDLESIYQSSAEGIIQIGIQVNTALSQPGVKEYIDNINEVNLAVNGLKNDLDSFTTQLVRIHKHHEGRSGVVNTPDDLAKSIAIFQEYVSFNEQFKAVTLPTVLTIMDHVGNACNRMMAEYNASKQNEPTETQTTPVAE